jgi:hypothetical protein
MKNLSRTYGTPFGTIVGSCCTAVAILRRTVFDGKHDFVSRGAVVRISRDPRPHTEGPQSASTNDGLPDDSRRSVCHQRQRAGKRHVPAADKDCGSSLRALIAALTLPAMKTTATATTRNALHSLAWSTCWLRPGPHEAFFCRAIEYPSQGRFGARSTYSLW